MKEYLDLVSVVLAADRHASAGATSAESASLTQTVLLRICLSLLR